MPQDGRIWRIFTLGMAALLLTLPAPASAHVTQSADRFRLTIGWGEEPAYSGLRNSVEVDVADAAGKPVTDLRGPFSVEVSFGDDRLVLPLRPAAGEPGKFGASLVPTRPGTYTFRVVGRVQGQTIDVRSTCSDQTFDCVTDVSEVQFPAKDPSAGQLAEGVGRALPRAERALSTSVSAQNLAIAAIAVAALALAAAIGVGVWKGGKGA